MTIAEEQLTGGHLNGPIYRIGNTVRRQPSRNIKLLEQLLPWLDQQGFAYAPQFLGFDKSQRAIFSYLPGQALHPSTIKSAAFYRHLTILLKQLHDLTTSFIMSDNQQQCIIHGDLSPSNIICQGDALSGIIDWDFARIGNRLEDLAYYMWKWCLMDPLTYSQPSQYDKIKIIRDAYDVNFSTETIIKQISLEREEQKHFIRTNIEQGVFQGEQKEFFTQELRMIHVEESHFNPSLIHEILN